MIQSAIMEALQSMTKSEKKRLKRKALFNHGLKVANAFGIPSWEEVWAHILDESPWPEEEFHERHLDYHGEYKESTGKNAKDDEEAYKIWFYKHVLEPEQESRYKDNIRFFKCIDNVTCYRAMALPKSVDPTKHPDLGIFWSLSLEGAREYWPSKTRGITNSVVYEAKVDKKSIDMWETILARMNPTIGEMEDEVTLIKGAPIFVVEVSMVKNDEWTDVPVGAWRHA